MLNMSEKEKDVLTKLMDTVPKLDKEKQSYILGVAEGMVIAKESKGETDGQVAGF